MYYSHIPVLEGQCTELYHDLYVVTLKLSPSSSCQSFVSNNAYIYMQLIELPLTYECRRYIMALCQNHQHNHYYVHTLCLTITISTSAWGTQGWMNGQTDRKLLVTRALWQELIKQCGSMITGAHKAGNKQQMTASMLMKFHWQIPDACTCILTIKITYIVGHRLAAKFLQANCRLPEGCG